MPSYCAKDAVCTDDRVEGDFLPVMESDLDATLTISSRGDLGKCLARVKPVDGKGREEFAEERGTVHNPPGVLGVTATEVHHHSSCVRARSL